MSEHLLVLESAISDLGRWAWWVSHLPETFQVEFIATQLWNPPLKENNPPSDQIALRFHRPRLIYFLTQSESLPQDWPDRLHRDELDAFRIDSEAFTLTSAERLSEFIKKAISVRTFVGELGMDPLPQPEEAFLGILTEEVGLVVLAQSMSVFSHQGEVNPEAVMESHRKWWDYWREYWQRKDTSDPMPWDFACEVTIPAGPDVEPDTNE